MGTPESQGTAGIASGPLSDAPMRLVRHAMTQLVEVTAEMGRVVAELDPEQLDVDEFLESRARFGQLFETANAAAALVLQQFGLTSAQLRMMQFLRNHVGEPVPAAALGGVSCIWDWPRRARELHLEKGFRIMVGEKDGIPEGHYALGIDQHGSGRSDRWMLMNTIRRREEPPARRVLALLRAVQPEAVLTADLDYVAKGSSAGCIENLLREGWQISSQPESSTFDARSHRLESRSVPED